MNSVKQLLASPIKRSQRLIEMIITGGIEKGEIIPEIGAHSFSTMTVSAIEGTIFCPRMAGDKAWTSVVIDYLKGVMQVSTIDSCVLISFIDDPVFAIYVS